MTEMPTSAAKNSTFSVIGQDVTVTGDIDASVDLHVDGKVDGDIRCQTLVQGTDSEINGAVSADKARISGSVEGSIMATELIIESGAKVTGDVVYEKLSIEPGGHVEGSFRYKTAGTLKKEAPRATEPKKDMPQSAQKDAALTLVDEAPKTESKQASVL